MFEKIEQYVVLLYSKTSDATQVNEARQKLFIKGTRSLENIPPTKGALVQHARGAILQAGYMYMGTDIDLTVRGSFSNKLGLGKV